MKGCALENLVNHRGKKKRSSKVSFKKQVQIIAVLVQHIFTLIVCAHNF